MWNIQGVVINILPSVEVSPPIPRLFEGATSVCGGELASKSQLSHVL